MKRPAAFMLAIILALSFAGCVPSLPGIHGQVEDTPPAEVGVKPPLDSPVVSGGIVFPGGLLPREDYLPTPAPERYYDRAVLEPIPSNDYGRIWPYLGGTTSMMWMQGSLFGLCDDQGRIICEPVFNDAYIARIGGRELYVLIEFGRNEDGYEQNATTLAEIDGSRFEKFESVHWTEYSGDEMGHNRMFWWRDPVEYEYITAKKDGKWGVINSTGEVLLPYVYSEPVCFSEGLASILSDDGQTVSFIDIKGDVVLGPYDAPPEQQDEWSYEAGAIPITEKLLFHEGRARIYKDGKYGMIDKSGEIVIPIEHEFITSFQDGTAMTVQGVENYETTAYSVIDEAGKILVESTKYHVYRDKDGTIIVRDWDAEREYAVNAEGELEPHESEEMWTISGNIITYLNGKELVFPQGHNIEILNSGDIIVSNRISRKWWVCDNDGNRISPENTGIPSTWSEAQNGAFIYVFEDSEQYNGPFDLYDQKGNLLLAAGGFNVALPIGDRYMVRQRGVGGLIDKDGNFIIKVSLRDYLED